MEMGLSLQLVSQLSDKTKSVCIHTHLKYMFTHSKLYLCICLFPFLVTKSPDTNNLRGKGCPGSWDTVVMVRTPGGRSVSQYHIVVPGWKQREVIICAQCSFLFLFIPGPQPTETDLLTFKICLSLFNLIKLIPLNHP